MAANLRLGARHTKLVVRTLLGVLGLGLVVLTLFKGSLSWEDDAKYALFTVLALVAANELMRQRAREERAALAADALKAGTLDTDADALDIDADANGDADPDRQG